MAPGTACRLRLTPRQLEEDSSVGWQTIEAATGVAPALHRPPYGVYSPAGLRRPRTRSGAPAVVDMGQGLAQAHDAGRIAARAAGNLGAGDVILLHDADFYSALGSHERTVEALRLILGELEIRELATVLPA